jgi:hypothetical protein
MDRIEIQRALYVARNQYLAAKSAMEFQRREILFLKELESALDRTPLTEELFG